MSGAKSQKMNKSKISTIIEKYDDILEEELRGFKVLRDFGNIIENTAAFVEEELRSFDASHDFEHIKRVRTLSLLIAKEEVEDGHEIDLEIVQLSALLHDIGDWKYSGSESYGEETVTKWLLSQKYPTERTKAVKSIIRFVGFKNELSSDSKKEGSREAYIVQDADRLDALGATGIARAFSYGAVKV